MSEFEKRDEKDDLPRQRNVKVQAQRVPKT